MRAISEANHELSVASATFGFKPNTDLTKRPREAKRDDFIGDWTFRGFQNMIKSRIPTQKTKDHIEDGDGGPLHPLAPLVAVASGDRHRGFHHETLRSRGHRVAIST